MRECETMIVKRGDIYYADLRPVIGSEQGGVRPVLIIQNDMGNRYSPTVICAAITSQLHKAKLPTHVALDAHKYGIVKDYKAAMADQADEKVCHLDTEAIEKIDTALCVSLSLST